MIMDHDVSGCFGTTLAPQEIPSTRGLGISLIATSDDVTPQEITDQTDFTFTLIQVRWEHEMSTFSLGKCRSQPSDN